MDQQRDVGADAGLGREEKLLLLILDVVALFLRLSRKRTAKKTATHAEVIEYVRAWHES